MSSWFSGGKKTYIDSTPAEDTLNKAKAESTANRSTLTETAGGIVGSELNSNQVKKRDTLMGN